MTVAYFDASALVKLVVAEPGSVLAVELWNRADVAATSRVSDVEVPAAIEAANRNLRLADVAAARNLWATVSGGLRRVELSAEVAAQAGLLTQAHPLGGMDAIHLASALLTGTATIMATWDQRLHAAAQHEGLRCLPAIH